MSANIVIIRTFKLYKYRLSLLDPFIFQASVSLKRSVERRGLGDATLFMEVVLLETKTFIPCRVKLCSISKHQRRLAGVYLPPNSGRSRNLLS